jgi:hypothetical protein
MPAAAWTPSERAAQEVLINQMGLTPADAMRWSNLERMESNLRPTIGSNVNDSTNRYVNALQDRLTDTSYARLVALNTIRTFGEDWRSSVPSTSQNRELNDARRNVESFDRVLANTRVEIDALLQKHPQLLTTPATSPNPPRVM